MKRLEMYKDTPVDKGALKIALDRIHDQFVQGCSDGQVLRIIARRLSAWKLEIGRVRDRRICGWYGIGTDGLGDRSAHFLNEILAAGHRPSPEVLKLCRKLAQADCENLLTFIKLDSKTEPDVDYIMTHIYPGLRKPLLDAFAEAEHYSRNADETA